MQIAERAAQEREFIVRLKPTLERGPSAAARRLESLCAAQSGEARFKPREVLRLARLYLSEDRLDLRVARLLRVVLEGFERVTLAAYGRVQAVHDLSLRRAAPLFAQAPPVDVLRGRFG